jgi:hypothetical protein
MRKRIVIGAIAVVVIGAGAYVFSQPKEGTVEWHKQACESEARRIFKPTLFDRARRALDLPPRPNRYREHRRALVNLGYLEERQFILTNKPAKVLPALRQWATNDLRQDRLWSMDVISNNILTVRAERHSLPKWEEAVRRIDVPETK